MKDDGPKPPRPRAAPGRSLSRKLNLQSRLRGRLRGGVDRLLGADIFWGTAFAAVMFLLLGSQRCGNEIPEVLVGLPAPTDVRAPVDFNDIDETATAASRQAAVAAVLDVYNHDTARGAALEAGLTTLFETGRMVGAAGSPVGDDPSEATLRRLGHAPEIEREVKAALNHVMSGRIVSNRAVLARLPAITLVSRPSGTEREFARWDELVDLEAARAAARDKVRSRLDLSAADEAVLADLAATYVDANVLPDAEATRQRRDEAQNEERPVVLARRMGELLVHRGEVVTPQHQVTLRNARMALRGGLSPEFVVGLAIVVSMLAFVLYRYSRYHQRHFRKIIHLHALMVTTLLSMLLLARGIIWVSSKVVDGLSPPFDQLAWYTLLVPLGAGSILITLLANGRIALVYSAFVAILFGAMNGWNAHLVIWALLVQAAGVYAITTSRERSALIRAGLIVGLIAAVSALALAGVAGNLSTGGALYGAVLAFLGGAFGVGLLVSFTLPMLESLFEVLTDIRLLELSNVNNPLLAELAVRAPGSYNHSLVVGTLAEEAARAIGASSLFCRVAAFYHDIGKVKKPEYYVENQRGINAHDRLSPSMSALIIAAHVKDGVKMAREAGLPEQIVDIIPQHHGTKLMAYFYEKARRAAAPGDSPVKEEDFRYPGPKPQTREAAIFMLADSIEAAARTVQDPTPNRLRDVIQKVSNAIVVDGQLEECDLTFSDLQRIQDAFHRLLVSMYHHRVDYPGFQFNRPRAVPSGDRDVSEGKIARGR